MDVAPAHPCSRCEMPWVGRDVKTIIQLWKRCRDRQALPESGGILDQPEEIMRAFDAIDETIDRFRKTESDRLEAQAAADETLRRMNRGR